MTARVGIIGHPLGHSISPAFQQAAFDHLEMDAVYERWATPPEALAARVRGLRQSDYLGANVTIPYKQDVIPLLDEIDPLAARIGAVNTIVNLDQRLYGYNTDADGFLRSLREEAGFEPTGKTALIVGAGGAARAVAFALADANIDRILIVNRTPQRAQELARAVVSATGARVESDSLPPSGAPTRFDLIVQCTSIGMRGSPEDGRTPPIEALLQPGVLVCDLVYNPLETPLLRLAKQKGAKTLGGLGMLVYQGAAAFTLWTGREAPIGVMYAAAREALG
jgi:shikimate dehydrogenase